MIQHIMGTQKCEFPLYMFGRELDPIKFEVMA